ncbi:glucosaminidase domain-containing protein [Flavobacterium sp. J49]|uniref:glucosaminidase domain-containing protein n=1 Tax=Flavobacterium sp. J49 TaxID=2718534 RepID=UPI001593FD78|nr:glucosaminidase domain-containing protein [Flavobacterium sp. J49]MBF6640487.1 glucosaminidase domain-containing protein [Flavobacterium sp. J49]NIC01734.1 LysM peptidoglycan-binding domain-containing protein [Flavobacterium sp. J49]
MIKKFFLLLLMIFVASCGSNQSVVRTSQPDPRKTTTPVAQRVKKPILRPNQPKKSEEVVNSSNSSKQNNASSSEILEATTRVKVTTEMVLAYIDKYKILAKENMQKTGIPASVTLGQAILESGAGTGPLSMQANNHFGIKCHKEWTGPSIRYTDDEENECFRKYDDPSGSFRDHSYFLTSRPRYASLFQLGKDDYVAWAKGLKAAGYATDPKYPEKLIGLIERYQLSKYDAEVLGKAYVPVITKKEIAYTDEVQKYTVVKGDTLYSLSKKFNISIEELKRKNNLTDNSLSLGQTIIVK